MSTWDKKVRGGPVQANQVGARMLSQGGHRVKVAQRLMCIKICRRELRTRRYFGVGGERNKHEPVGRTKKGQCGTSWIRNDSSSWAETVGLENSLKKQGLGGKGKKIPGDGSGYKCLSSRGGTDRAQGSGKARKEGRRLRGGIQGFSSGYQ